MKKVLKNKKGFTLVELVVVIAILAILALILVPSISGYVSSAEDAKDEASARSIYTAALLAQAKGDDVSTALEIAGAENTGATVTESETGEITVQYNGKNYTAASFGQ